MIERASEFGASAAVPLASAETEELTAGDMLRQAREAHGLDIAVVAAALKVPPQKIEALEADDIDALPDPVFARALAASMSRALRLDPGPVLARLPGAPRRGFGPTLRPLGASFHTGVPRANGSPLSRTLWTVVALLLVGAAAVVFVPQSVFERASAGLSGLMPQSDNAADADKAMQQAAPAADAPGDTAAAAPGQVVEPVSPAASAASGTASVPPNDTTSAATGAPGSTAATTAPLVSGARPLQDSSAAASAAAKAEASNDLLAFNAREDAWISVTDSTGKQLLRRLVKAGENVPLNGTPPLSVVVGRASAVEVLVKGKPLDISTGSGSGGVARFEVKP